MYSDRSKRHLRRQSLRERARRVRQLLLLGVLAVVAIWGWQNYRADHHTFAWDEPVSVAAVALFDATQSNPSRAGWFIQRFFSRAAVPRNNLLEVENWLQSEFTRHTGEDRQILRVSVRGPVELERPPPALPAAGASFLDRWNASSDFLEYFRQVRSREELLLGDSDVTLFVYFYDASDEERTHVFSQLDSVASRRDRMGIVFAPISTRQLGYTTAVVAHELCHTLGATDKYDGAASVFPEGYAEPDLQPRYPQRKAEIMSLGRPVAPGRDASANSLRQCVVGDATANEIHWVATDD